MTKYSITSYECQSVFSLSGDGDGDGLQVELSDEDFADYQRAATAFEAWQDRLRGLRDKERVRVQAELLQARGLLEGLLEVDVECRMRSLGVLGEDRRAVWKILSPLEEKNRTHWEHCLRVGLLASRIAELEGEDARALLLAGLLHDAGKALVPACTLGATVSWTDEDRLAVETHVLDGYRLLRDRFDFTARVIAWHHQFQDRPYPEKLPPPAQPFSEETLERARWYGLLLVVADVYDALHRVNSATGGRALSPEEVRDRMLALRPDLLGDLVPRLYVLEVLR